MAAHLNIHVCRTRKERTIGRQYHRRHTETSVFLDPKIQALDPRNKHYWLKSQTYQTYREFLVNGVWYHEKFFTQHINDFQKILGDKKPKNRMCIGRRIQYPNFFDAQRMPSIEIGSSNDQSGLVFKVGELFGEHALTMINDDLITKIAVYLDEISVDIGDDSEWRLKENKDILAFFERHKGLRAFGIFW